MIACAFLAPWGRSSNRPCARTTHPPSARNRGTFLHKNLYSKAKEGGRRGRMGAPDLLLNSTLKVIQLLLSLSMLRLRLRLLRLLTRAHEHSQLIPACRVRPTCLANTRLATHAHAHATRERSHARRRADLESLDELGGGSYLVSLKMQALFQPRLGLLKDIRLLLPRPSAQMHWRRGSPQGWQRCARAIAWWCAGETCFIAAVCCSAMILPASASALLSRASLNTRYRRQAQERGGGRRSHDQLATSTRITASSSFHMGEASLRSSTT